METSYPLKLKHPHLGSMFNAQGGSVFTNFVNAVNDGQFFLLDTGSYVYEKPASETVQGTDDLMRRTSERKYKQTIPASMRCI